MGRDDTGKQQQKSFTTQDKAEAFKRTVDRLGWEVAVEIEARRGGKDAPTLRDWAAKYLDPNSGILTGVDSGTRDKYATQAEHFLERLGPLPLDAITRDDVGAWIEWQLNQTWRRGPNSAPVKYSSSSVVFMHVLLSNMFKAAIERELVTKNPAFRAKIKNTSEHEPVFLSREQYDALYAAMDDAYKPFTQFLVGTQCRFSEAAALRWTNVISDTNRPYVRIIRTVKSAGKGKGKTEGVTKTKRGKRTISGTRGHPG